MSILLYIEILATVFSIGYLILLIRQNIWCWPLAIVGSSLSIYLFVDAKLYSEAILYGFYVAAAIYGWWLWGKPKKPKPVTEWGWQTQSLLIGIGLLSGFGIGYVFKTFTDAAKPLIDAMTTAFSLIASYMEAHKVLSGWIYWIIINLTSIFLYYSRGLEVYAGLMVVFTVLSILGYTNWKKAFSQAQ